MIPRFWNFMPRQAVPPRKVLTAITTVSLIMLLLLQGQPSYPAHAAEADDPIAARVAQMTLEEKVGQMLIIRFWGTDANSTVRSVIEKIHPGGIVLIKQNLTDPAGITTLTNGLQQAAMEAGGIPLAIMLDQEGRRIQRLREGFAALPPPFLLGAIADTAILEQYGTLLASQIRAVGVNMTLAPSLDLATYPNSPVMRGRMYGDNPQRVSTVTNALIAGMDAASGIAAAKHFPGHGDVIDTHVHLGILAGDLARLRAVEMLPFTQTRAPVMLVGHISVPSLDPSGLPATFSPTILGYLRERYTGVIMTDAMDMGAVLNNYQYLDAVVQSVAAGADWVLLGANVANDKQFAAHQAIITAVRKGTIPLAQIDASVTRLLKMKQAHGLATWQPLDPAQVNQRLAATNADQVLAQVRAAAVTLMRNENRLMPLATTKQVGIVYPAAYPAARCEAASGSNVIQRYGFTTAPDAGVIRQTIRLAAQVDALVIFTENADQIAEYQTLIGSLPPEKTIVVALESPFDWRAFKSIAGYLLTYEADSAGIDQACAIIFGKATPRGLLPVTLAKEYPAGTGLR